MGMTEQEKRMEQCSHVWVYAGTSFDDVFVRCPRCGLTRVAMPGETTHLVNRELKVGKNDEGGDV